MQIRQAPSKKKSLKEVKVQLPIPMHLQLHTLKLTTGQQINQTVRSALMEYFDEVGLNRDKAGGSE